MITIALDFIDVSPNRNCIRAEGGCKSPVASAPKLDSRLKYLVQAQSDLGETLATF